MHHFVDRRENPKGKSLGNRQRFIRRTRHHLKEIVDEAVRKRSIRDLERGESVSVPTKSVDEPEFVHSHETGRRTHVFTGNREFNVGDRISRPQDGGGEGGREGSPDGGGEDAFSFALTKEEFLDILFEDLELPDLVKTDLTDVRVTRPQRAGYATSGIAANLNVVRTMRNAYGRRIALRRPSRARLEQLAREIEALESEEPGSDARETALAALREELDGLERKRKAVAFVDPIDVRYNRFTSRPEPNTKAVMFCLMDVSGSMGEREKDLAKRFFILLHLFLERRYESTEIVFIRHTHFAQEVDEETFFYGRETGGTVVSTAIAEMERIIAERFPTNDWNIYVAQASDGENLAGDSEKCAQRLREHTMRLCQYFAYIEIADHPIGDASRDSRAGAELWRSFYGVAEEWPNFQMCRVGERGDIYPVFRELFERRERT